MIQELLMGRNSGLTGGGGERKISIAAILEGSSLPSSSPSSSTTAIPTSSSTTTSENQNLRCPRCDSSNTKFCYYNNYNLTQPRHFCKTCRRYWTKGGALRNVPIGGGCRKNKNTLITTPVGKSIAGKSKTFPLEIGKPGHITSGFETNPILWASPQPSHLLSLLRGTSPNSKSNPNPNPMNLDSWVGTGTLSGRTHETPQNPMGLYSSFWRNNQENQNQQNGFVLGEIQNSGIQELYQRLKASTNNYYSDHQSPVVLGNAVSSSTTSSTFLESPAVAGGEMGYWNNTFSWSDLPTTNGAYP